MGKLIISGETLDAGAVSMHGDDDIFELPFPGGHPSEDERHRILMTRISAGDRPSLELLIERFWSPLVTYSVGFVGEQDEAEDIVQEAFVQVWRHRDVWRPSGTVSAYLYRITRNLSFNSVRNRKARQKWDRLRAEEVFHSLPPRTAEEEFESELLHEEVEAAIAGLPERRREIFCLSRYHGLTHREIAEALGISMQTVSNQMTTALNDLRRSLAHRLGAE